MRRWWRLTAAVWVTAATAACGPGWATDTTVPPPKALAPCAWWYGIGEPPTDDELEFAAKHYDVVVLNAWELDALRKLHDLNPEVKVLVYKDLSSTRNYEGAVNGDVDAPLLPTGIGYYAAQNNHPHWFAVDIAGSRISWAGYAKHWQMTVWDPGYQKAWAEAVTEEVVDKGWDGVLADNDFNTLSHYSPAILEGTANTDETDELLRDGLDQLLAVAGKSLLDAEKILVPNVAETYLVPGRWAAHSRFSGAMEENFGFRDDGGSGDLLTFRGNQWRELRAQAALGESWLLLITRTKDARQERAGYASAALLAGPYTCWTRATTQTYLDPEWSALQDTGLGEAVDWATREPTGVWTRTFTGGWVAVNPTATAAAVTPPEGLVDLDGSPVSQLELPPADGVVLVKPSDKEPAAPPS
jgi:Hypothetical glycosyl hydrolase family 15